MVLPCTAPLERVLELKPKGIILSGGPSSVYDETAPKADAKVLATGLPTLGICYGLQFMTHHLGGRVAPAAAREYGHAEVEVIAETPPLDLRLMAFAFALTVLNGIAFGVMPALRGCTRAGAQRLHEAARGGIAERRERGRLALVAAEVTGSVVLFCPVSRSRVMMPVADTWGSSAESACGLASRAARRVSSASRSCGSFCKAR